ncbi:hypothetical protein [Saccharospirillum impatiens]|uniref:hypothetical protein n=1 Tax=Saccharospirillum impatiens TaxID=169438 RepID=UPI00048F0F6C|nr:hypothetical protein [Saccharospirillum impatiens]
MYQLAYGNLTKYWTTIATAVVMLPLLALALIYISPSDLENPFALLIILLPIAYNLYSDLRNYSKLSTYQVTELGVKFDAKVISWFSIDSYERFGPTVRHSRNGTDIKLFSASGVFIKVSGEEYIVYASAKNYKKFIGQMASNGVRCENA